MPTATILLRPAKPSELDTIKTTTTIFFDKPVYFQIKQFGNHPHQQLSLNPTEKKEIDQTILNQLLAFGERIYKGKPYIEYLFHERLNIFYYNKFRLYFSLRNKAYLQHQITKLAKEYDQLIIYTTVPLTKAVKELGNVVEKYQKPPKQPLNFQAIQRYLRAITIRFWKGFKYRKNAQKSPYLIVNRPKDEHLLKRLDDLKEVKNNAYLGYVLEKHGQEAVILEELVLPKLKGENPVNYMEHTQTRQAEGRVIYGEYIMGRVLFRTFLWRKAVGILRGLMNHLLDLLEYEEDPFHQEIIRQLIQLKNTHLYFLMRYIAYQRFFEQHPHFKSVTSIDENSSYIKSILDAAKSQEVKTLGIQHGAINQQSPNYMFAKADETHHPMPDKTLVWGTDWRKLLVEKGHFPSNSVGVVGQIRSDIIPRLKRLEKKKEHQGFTILFASQPIPNETLRKRALKDVLQAVKAHEDWHLIIKPHPRETNKTYFDEIAKEVGMSRYEWLLEVDLYHLLSQCDVLITCYSTVGGEAVYFNKPLVVMDHLKEDLVNYVKDGVAFQAINAVELEAILEGVKQGDLTVNKTAYQTYIERYAYKIDGEVVERVWAEMLD